MSDTKTLQAQRLIISAPFGNYLRFPHATSTLGTYTLQFRGGTWKRVWRVLRTVRYYRGIQAWKNMLGLPNPGIQDLYTRAHFSAVVQDRIKNSILSISARNTDDWLSLIEVAGDLKALALELNVSCPNCPGEKDLSHYREVFRMAVARFGPQTIVKLPPVWYHGYLHDARSEGIGAFHCCNTLPTPGGGLSGKPLKPLALAAVSDVAATEGVHSVIGGGGVTCWADVHEFLNAGASHVAVASALFNPLRWRSIRSIATRLAEEETNHAEPSHDQEVL